MVLKITSFVFKVLIYELKNQRLEMSRIYKFSRSLVRFIFLNFGPASMYMISCEIVTFFWASES